MNIENVKNKIQLENVVGKYVELKPHSNYLTGRCPFHQDGGRPNFVVYPGSQKFTCFVCGAQGDVIDFLARIEGLSTRDAIRKLERDDLPALARRVRSMSTGAGEDGGLAARDAAYAAMISLLTLSPAHDVALQARGLPPSVITANAYRTLPEEGRGRVVNEMVDRMVQLSGVPGLAVSRRSEKWWLYGKPGLLIPVRGVQGRIAGMQVRVDVGASRYVWLSTPDNEWRYGGASSGTPCHVAGREHARRGCDIYITEGPLKADITAHFLGTTVLGVAGVTSWRKAVPIVRALQPDRVFLAFDQDTDESTRSAVRRQVGMLAAVLGRVGVPVQTVSWAAGKGIDDALKAGAHIKTS